MKKYKTTLLMLIISVLVIAGFVAYNNYSKQWNDAEKYIDKYMVYQGVPKEDVNIITKEKSTIGNYKGILYKVSYEDDPGYEYHYFYSDDYHALYVNKVMLEIYDVENSNKLLKSNEELKDVKYPPIYLKDELDK